MLLGSFEYGNKNIWGKPSRYYFDFLSRIEKDGLPKTLAVLGCADGKFVIPAVTKGFRILAIDTDKTSLFGGKVTVVNKQINIIGLRQKLIDKGLTDKVEIARADYLAYEPKEQYSGVYTSSTIHYESNFKYSLEDILMKIQSYVHPKGYLSFKYIHKSKYNNSKRKHYVTSEQVERFFRNTKWGILSHKKWTVTEGPNPQIDSVHKIQWGRLYARRIGK